MKLDIKVSGMNETRLALAGLSRKIPVIVKRALNDAAYLGSKTTAEEIGKVFDRPTPWVKGGVRYVKARDNKLEASIDLDKWGNKTAVSVDMVLAAEIFGGQRRLKRHERALQSIRVLPPGYAIVPGAAAKIDAFGNMAASQIRQILSWFSAARMTSGYNGNMTDRRKASLAKGSRRTGAVGFEYFAVAPGQRRQFARSNGKSGSHAMQPGIYQRVFLGHGTAIRPVMIFVKVPSYKKRLDFYGIVERAALPEFDRAFTAYTDQFLRERGL